LIGGCEDEEFAVDSEALWQQFIAGNQMLVLSDHTLRELEEAPSTVWKHLERVPEEHQILF